MAAVKQIGSRPVGPRLALELDLRSLLQAQETFPMALEAEHARHQLDRLRRDARKQAAAAVNRVIWQARADKALESDRIYGAFERAVEGAFREALNAAARIMLDLPTEVVLDRVSALERMATDLAADVLADREDRRGSVGRVRLDGPDFDEHVRRMRASMDVERGKAVAEFRSGLTEGRPVSSPGSVSVKAFLDNAVAIRQAASADYQTITFQLAQLLRYDEIRALRDQEQTDIAAAVMEIATEIQKLTPQDEIIRQKLRNLARALKGIGIAAGGEVGNIIRSWLT
jgi:hypothetical protein